MRVPVTRLEQSAGIYSRSDGSSIRTFFNPVEWGGKFSLPVWVKEGVVILGLMSIFVLGYLVVEAVR